MKVTIRDVAAVQAIRPVDAALYLRARGWAKKESAIERASLWSYGEGDDEFEVLLPMDVQLRDYALRMGDVLAVLAAAEERSQWQVYTDLLTVTSDVIRIRIADPELSDGTLPIEEHAKIAQKTRDLVLAAACAATERRPVWHKRKPAQAMEHVRRVRIGQSERGSYIVTVISRVPPFLHAKTEQSFEMEVPFERQVTQTLAQSLRALDRAAEHAALTQEMEAFDQAVRQGVNANLCDAVVGLWGDDEAQRNLEFIFSWSPARPPAPDTVRRVALSSDRVPVIREAGTQMREREPLPDFELSGPVVKLERAEGAPTGRVTVIGLVGDRQARVMLELADEPYHLAVQAHDSGRTIRASGTLTREGRGFFLRNAGDLVIEEE
ncbi:MAG: hypothetical protein RDU20_22425 [Desulfomonilaceae bacterium]|nr:hypothetical protein [Desulfomonilaceae bacterium]